MRFTKALLIFPIFGGLMVSCGEDNTDLQVPENYEFIREGNSTVSYDGQTTRLEMGKELNDALVDPSYMAAHLEAMFANDQAAGFDPLFAEASLNNSTKSIKSKVAASEDFFTSNTAESSAIRERLSGYLSAQAETVFPASQQLAALGIAGQIADGTNSRLINGKGLEYDQAFGKSLIGALVMDQIANNYLSPAVLDAGSNRAENDAGTTVADKPYTNMEHKWDEAYGYLFGSNDGGTNPLPTLGQNDDYLEKYLARVNGDDDFSGIAQTIFDAFKTGRAAIVAGDYDERDKQADIIIDNLNDVIAIRAAYYLLQGATKLELAANTGEFGGAFHDLSEGYGFIYSLRFARKTGSAAPLFDSDFVNTALDKIYYTPENGFWSVTPEVLREVAQDIADGAGIDIEKVNN